ncbi:hypothetical protein ACFL96_16530, partial [Thermoproteota archaeon]
MKRGNPGYLVMFLLMITVSLMLVPIVSGGEGGESSDTGDLTQCGTHLEYEKDYCDAHAADPDNVWTESASEMSGYWLALVEGEENDGTLDKIYFFPVASGADPVLVNKVLNLKPNADRKIDDDGEESSEDMVISLETLYDDFPIPDNEEIIKLRFVLDILPFKIDQIAFDEWDGLRSSHGTLPTSAYFREPECSAGYLYVDVFPDETSSLPDYTCLEFPVTDTELGCNSISDYSAQFCEGVSLIGPNALIGDVQVPGTGGLGGCQKAPDKFSTGRENRRDWAADDQSSDYLGDFTNCCGGDRYDIGMVAEYESVPNRLLCKNATRFDLATLGVFWDVPNMASTGAWDYRWADATNLEYMFHVQKFKRDGYVNYEAVSNSEQWFICGSPGDVTYEGFLKRTNYQGLPAPSGGFIGTTNLPGVSDVDDGGWGFGTDATGSGGSGMADVKKVDEISDGVEVYGPTSITACDGDGDGYDFDYIDFPGNDDYYDTDCDDTPTLCCHDPKEPFDCGAPMVEGGLLRSPGNVEICNDGLDNDCDNDEFTNDTVNCVEPSDGNTSTTMGFSDFTGAQLANRFICYDNDYPGAWAECCGYSSDWCANDFPTGRRQGAVLTTLREFDNFSATTEGGAPSDCGVTANCAARFGFGRPRAGACDYGTNNGAESSCPDAESAIYGMGFYSELNDIAVTHFDDYTFIEFDIYFAANFILNFTVGTLIDSSIDTTINPGGGYDDYTYAFNVRVIDYVVDEPKLGEWLHVMIPLQELVSDSLDLHNIDVMAFIAKAIDLYNSGDMVQIPGICSFGTNTDCFSNVIGVDKIS